MRRVYYPGLPSHPDHEVARRQMSGFGGVVSFEIEGDFETTGRFIDRLHLPYIGPTLGGVESIIEQPAALFSLDPEERRKAGLTDNLVRYALGIEDARRPHRRPGTGAGPIQASRGTAVSARLDSATLGTDPA